jgi:hypothetical protein
MKTNDLQAAEKAERRADRTVKLTLTALLLVGVLVQLVAGEPLWLPLVQLNAGIVAIWRLW